MGSDALWLARLFLAAVFSIAGVSKLANPRPLVRSLVAVGMSSHLARPLAKSVSVLEVTLAGALLTLDGNALTVSMVMATGLLAAFSVWIGIVLVRKSGVGCGCFGARDRVVAAWTLVRNGSLLGVSCAGTWLSRKHQPLRVADHPVAAVAVGVFLSVGVGWLVWKDRRSHAALRRANADRSPGDQVDAVRASLVPASRPAPPPDGNDARHGHGRFIRGAGPPPQTILSHCGGGGSTRSGWPTA